MNWASARCRRTIAPFITTKRAPESRPAASKSRPAFAAGISKCSSGLKREVPRAAPAVDLDVGGLVGAVGDVVAGQVGDAHEQVAERGVGGGGLGLEAGDLVLLVGDERAEALELGLVAAGLGGADRLLAALRSASAGLGGGDAGAAGLVEGEDLGASRRQAAAGEGGVEGVRAPRGSGGCRASGVLERVRGGLCRIAGTGSKA